MYGIGEGTSRSMWSFVVFLEWSFLTIHHPHTTLRLWCCLPKSRKHVPLSAALHYSIHAQVCVMYAPSRAASEPICIHTLLFQTQTDLNVEPLSLHAPRLSLLNLISPSSPLGLSAVDGFPAPTAQVNSAAAGWKQPRVEMVSAAASISRTASKTEVCSQLFAEIDTECVSSCSCGFQTVFGSQGGDQGPGC